MTFKVDDRIRETSTTTGTGTYTLDGAPTGFQSFSVLSASNHCPYFATDGVDWEVGIGEVATGPNRLLRNAVKSSSNGDAAVSWGAGTRTLRCGWPAWLAIPRSNSKSVAGSADVTLTQDEQRCHLLTLTGALTGNISVIVDATPWEWTIVNNTSGNFTLTVKVSGQPGVESYQARAMRYACNGTDVVRVGTEIPPGAILDYGADTIAAGGYLSADGSNVSRATYSALFNKYGTTHGVGDGSTTFGTPDSRRRVMVGKGGSGTATLANTVGATGGAETYTLTVANLPGHQHTGTSNSENAGHTHLYNNASNDLVTLGPAGGVYGYYMQSAAIATGGTSANHQHTFTSDVTGSGVAHTIMQPSLVVTKMIKI